MNDDERIADEMGFDPEDMDADEDYNEMAPGIDDDENVTEDPMGDEPGLGEEDYGVPEEEK
jgi:hypothetical protein